MNLLSRDRDKHIPAGAWWGNQGWRVEFSDGADSSKEGAKMQLPGYYVCQKAPKNSSSPTSRGLTCSKMGALAPSSPLAPPLGTEPLIEKVEWLFSMVQAGFVSPHHFHQSPA